ncbi:MAG: hypothetical protein JSW70_03250 [Syntrophobacterales bacterium]|nr:MAG: hypothetical protein JSW70_03250 [Syntrophobacterales bacterium]
MKRKIRIRIAEITIAIEWEDRNLHCRLHPTYQPFRSNGKSDIVLRLREATQDIPLGKKIFDCAPVWTLYRRNGYRIIKLFTDEWDPSIERVMVMNPSLYRGELYVKKPADESSFAIEPFSGVTAELLMVHYLAQGKGVLLHSCGIELDGKGILFVGHSGAGKSTMARLCNNAGDVPILSDDRIIVRKKDGIFWMYGTPWQGEEQFASPKGHPLHRIYFIKHARKNKITKTDEIGATSKLLTCSFPPFWDKKGMRFTLDFLSDLSNTIPCRELRFVPDESIVPFIQSRD